MAYSQQPGFNPDMQQGYGQQPSGYLQPHGYSAPATGSYPPPTGGSHPPPAGGSYPPTSGSYYPPPGFSPHPPAYGQQQPITQQPAPGYMPTAGTDNWIHVPTVIPANCPNGLQYLTTVDQLLVKQKVELLEAFIGFETNNKYSIKSSQGDNVYYAVEDNDCCTRMCCGPLRSFDMKILDRMNTEVIHLRRDYACDTCWFPCCLQHLEVYSPPGNFVGSIQQTWSICTPEFDVKNHVGDVVLKIEGPICRYSFCGGNVDFKVLSRDKSCVVGKISKQWGGLMREAFTDADQFGISFPLDLDVRMKAVMIGTCFLIDFMYFEKSGDNRERDGIGLC